MGIGKGLHGAALTLDARQKRMMRRQVNAMKDERMKNMMKGWHSRKKMVS
jgi:hypothetical protein